MSRTNLDIYFESYRDIYFNTYLDTYLDASVTRLGDLLDFGQLFNAFGNNYFAKIFHILRIFCKGVKIYHFSTEIIGQLL